MTESKEEIDVHQAAQGLEKGGEEAREGLLIKMGSQKRR